MASFPQLLKLVDDFLIAPYRWPSNPLIGWWMGTSILAFWAVLLGDLTQKIAVKANEDHIRNALQEMASRHNQSLNALQAGDKKSYKEINKLANEAYGKTFFIQVAIACASLWPVPFALAWLNTRFSKIDFPLLIHLPAVGNSVRYPFLFILLYILIRILWGKVKNLVAATTMRAP
jgi:hypothetical protein